ncbi:MAG: hypothetical protein V1737_05420 [Chloroflexota bacterium]
MGEEAKVQTLYDLAASMKESDKPKRSLFSVKCPKCGEKLRKESLKETIYSGAGATEFANKVAADAKFPEGVYILKLDHFTCNCGYEFARSKVDTLGERSA